MSFWLFVVNGHAPLKTKFISGNQLPYINNALCKTEKYRTMYAKLQKHKSKISQAVD